MEEQNMSGKDEITIENFEDTKEVIRSDGSDSSDRVVCGEDEPVLASKIREIVRESSEDKGEDFLYEWKVFKYQGEYGACECGREIHHAYFLQNVENEKILCLGKDCLERLGSQLLMDTGKILKREATNKKKKVCGCCLKSLLPKMGPPTRIKCKTCYENQKSVNQAYKNLYFGACTECGSCDIAPGSPEYVKTCPECYELKKAASRECELCGKKRISPKESEWTKICFPCKKESGPKNCEQCGEPKLLKLDWQKVCADCYRRSKK
jgi:hypothetical protein